MYFLRRKFMRENIENEIVQVKIENVKLDNKRVKFEIVNKVKKSKCQRLNSWRSNFLIWLYILVRIVLVMNCKGLWCWFKFQLVSYYFYFLYININKKYLLLYCCILLVF